MPGSHPTRYLMYEYADRGQTCDLQKLQVARLTVPLFLKRQKVAGASEYRAEGTVTLNSECKQTIPARLLDTSALQHLLRQPPGGLCLIRTAADELCR